MQVLFAVWECDPLIKVGGLGDVARDLPKALKLKDIDVRIILPFYKTLKLARVRTKKAGSIALKYAGIREVIEIFRIMHPISRAPVYLLKNKRYFDVAKFPDTYALFCLAVVRIIEKNILSWKPDLIHCNDLHTGLIPLLSRMINLPVKTLFTIHNLAYQGEGGTAVFDKLGIDLRKTAVFRWKDEMKRFNFMIEGIIHADMVSTVSPTYSQEILTKDYGCGLDEVLKGKEGKIFGILNGIEVNWKNNKYITEPEVSDWKETKEKNKLFLQRKLGLRIDASIPLLAYIGRLDPWQKGIDILFTMFKDMDLNKMEFVFLGTGDKVWENKFRWYSQFYPKNIYTGFTFDDSLAHEIYAASDFVLIPSRYEPCGLVQMIGMGFGTLPVARKTGGLADSIKDGVNGFLFEEYSARALKHAVDRAMKFYREDKSRYDEMVEQAISTDFSWEKSAEKYIELYNKLVNDNF